MSAEVGFRQGTVTAWNAETTENTVVIGGVPFYDLPVLVQMDKRPTEVGDVVAVLTSKNQLLIAGRLRTIEDAT